MIFCQKKTERTIYKQIEIGVCGKCRKIKFSVCRRQDGSLQCNSCWFPNTRETRKCIDCGAFITKGIVCDSCRQRRKQMDKERKGDYRYHLRLFGYVYLMSSTRPNYFKIGASVQPKVRLIQIKYKTPFASEIVHTIKADHQWKAERLLHRKFANKRDRSEWFFLDESDVEYIMSLVRFRQGRFVRIMEGEKEVER